MSAPLPFYLVTDDAREAALTLFAREPEFVPAFVTVVTQIGQLIAIPNQSRAFAFWSRKPGVLAQVWREQRGRLMLPKGWQIIDEIAVWRESLWRDAQEVAAPPPPSSIAPAIVQAARKARWS